MHKIYIFAVALTASALAIPLPAASVNHENSPISVRRDGLSAGGLLPAFFKRTPIVEATSENALYDISDEVKRSIEERGRGGNSGGDIARSIEERGRGGNSGGDIARSIEERGRGGNSGGDIARSIEERGRGGNSGGDIARSIEERGGS